ncbi:MAG: helix-turn-helix transcriptional regulator [Clostridia bacterium]|nr:helix-turn-helix transcriptional regulator [Clostridia bacterium]
MDFVLKPFREEITVKRLANIHYFEFTPNYQTAGDSHPFCELLYVDSGSINIEAEHYAGLLKQGQMIVHGENEKHALVCNEKGAPNVIIIGFECTSEKIDALTYSPLQLSNELQKMLAEIIKEARTVYLPPYDVPNLKDMKKREEFSFGADQLIKNLLQVFLIKCLRGLENGNASRPQTEAAKQTEIKKIDELHMEEVKKYLDDNFTQKINVDELCFLFGTNKTTLSREFKRLYGKTIIDHVNTLRVEYTKTLLRENSCTLTQIAALLNVSSVHYLTALFKKYVHLTPTEYLHTIKKKLDEK